MDWSQAQDKGQRVWVHVRERTAFAATERPLPFFTRLMRLLITAMMIGLLAILAILGLTVGLVILLVVAVVVLLRRAWRALTGGIAMGGEADKGRRNVRVIQRH